MKEQDIINFKQEICNLSLEELQKKEAELHESVVKMILDTDLVVKLAIIENCIKEKNNG